MLHRPLLGEPGPPPTCWVSEPTTSCPHRPCPSLPGACGLRGDLGGRGASEGEVGSPTGSAGLVQEPATSWGLCGGSGCHRGRVAPSYPGGQENPDRERPAGWAVLSLQRREGASEADTPRSWSWSPPRASLGRQVREDHGKPQGTGPQARQQRPTLGLAPMGITDPGGSSTLA